jgi:DNA-binding NarL/FixJ family response regulator
MGRPAVELTVTAQDRRQLESMTRSQSLPAALARRAQMILRLADGESNSAVARRYWVSRPTVASWRWVFWPIVTSHFGNVTAHFGAT